VLRAHLCGDVTASLATFHAIVLRALQQNSSHHPNERELRVEPVPVKRS
jgi:hypothetical protein